MRLLQRRFRPQWTLTIYQQPSPAPSGLVIRLATIPQGRQNLVSEHPAKTPAKPQKSKLVQPARVKKSTGSIKPRKPQCTPQSNTPTINPPIHQSNDPATPPALDPETEAYDRWFRMNSGAEPFDYDALQKLYAAIPK